MPLPTRAVGLGLQVEAMTEALPQFISNIGNRRRLERGWLAWRLAIAWVREDRAQEAIAQAEAMLAAQPSTRSV